ncbi:neuraminidase-like domain-containing protein, partial [Enterobacter ludwigii]
MNTLEKQIEARLLSAPLYQALSGEGGMPLQEAAARLKNGTLPGHLAGWREEIRRRAPEVQALLRDVWSRHDPAWQTAPDVRTADPFLDSLDVDITEEYCDPASLQSKLSLASYLRTLYALATALRYEKPADPPGTGSVEDDDYLLDTRRPDLGELALSEDNLNQEISTLRLANEVMVARAREGEETEDALYRRLASSGAAFSLPYNRCQTGMRLGLAMQEENSLNRIALAIREQDNVLSDAAYTRAPNVRDQLGLCDEEIRLLKAPATDDTDETAGVYREVDAFLDYTGLSFGELTQMLCRDGVGHVDGRAEAGADHYAAWYINAGRVIPAGSTSGVVTVSKNARGRLALTHRVTTPAAVTETPVSNTVMGNMLRLARLYRRTGLSFAELDRLLQTACRLAEKTAATFRLDDAALSLIARYLAWRTRDNMPVDAWVGLLCESSPWYRRGQQETAYLSQVYGPRNALWIARYAAGTDSAGQRYLGRAPAAGQTLLSEAEMAGLQQALHLSQPDWDAVLTLVIPPLATVRLFDWACLAALHRLSLLLHTLGWETGDATAMLKATAPALLATLAGGNTEALPGALERLVWLHERLAAWQVTPAALLEMVQVAGGEQQGTQEQVNSLNMLYQNLKPARLTAESFLAYRQVKAETGPASAGPVVIDWLYELQDREATGSEPPFRGPLDPDGLVRDNSRDAMNTAVGEILARHAVPNAGVQQGVLDLLLMAQQSIGILLSARLDDGAPDDPEDNVETLLLLLKWMDRAGTGPVTAYQVLRTLLAWHLSPERAGDTAPLMDLVTLNASAEVQRNIRKCTGEIARYIQVIRAFRLKNSDLRLLADCPEIFTADTTEPLALDFSLLMTLGQLKGLERGAAGPDDWGAYFTRRAGAGSETEMTALRATLGSLLGCEEAELAALLQEQAPDNSLPLRVADIDWMARKLGQARGLQLDYLTFGPVRSMAGRVTGAAADDQPWEEQQQATAAMVAGQLRAGASLEVPARLLEEANRDALVGYLLNGRLKVAGLVRAEQLYSYLLLDVNIGGEVLTTRLAEAVSSVQLCLQRALAGCERATAPTRSAVAAVWADSYPYGHWRAGQERLLFPANHVDPSLLAGASEGYGAFMAALEQGRLDDEQIHQALSPYLDSLSGLGRATIGNIALLPAEAADEGEELLWLTACPPGSSASWYWRELRLNGSGLLTSTPWEKIELAIPRDNFSVPVVLRVNGTLNALWVEHDERPRQSGDGTVDTKRHVYRARRACRLESGKWGEPEGVWIQPVTPTVRTVDGKKVATHPVKVEEPRVLELLSALPPGETPCRLGGCWLNTDLWVFRRVFPDESRVKPDATSGWQPP